MNKVVIFRYGIIALILVLWAGTLINISYSINAATQLQITGRNKNEVYFQAEFEQIDNILRNKRVIPFPTFEPTTPNPFKSYGIRKSQPNRAIPDKPERILLRLKGILLRATPYAIIEDDQGKVYIAKAGTIIAGQKVLSINKNSVTLRDEIGTYRLERK